MEINFDKNKDGLLPAIIQDSETKTVLMLGYMNEEAYDRTIQTNRITFFSRSKKRLWTKGEESGHFLELVSIGLDCDQDTFLIQAIPSGPVCHTGADTCWQQVNHLDYGFLLKLEETIKSRRDSNDSKSYVASLFKKGINKIAQKVGEEAIEMVIEAKDSNGLLFLNESADLLFHYLILLQAKNYSLTEVVAILESRNHTQQ
ncbi:MAG: bifunctional phosphoribosyl-AMP cyclohydrolase/phosphoribosyl-ATP diphosphatase HisIE [Burkholderiales bacterium]|nr:bifunctional phosphoribosyl-AMP cyclohydrolase/phosphoribosyl-ATP diphosphatase HisIE [Flavobacterium sp.]